MPGWLLIKLIKFSALGDFKRQGTKAKYARTHWSDSGQFHKHQGSADVTGARIELWAPVLCVPLLFTVN